MNLNNTPTYNGEAIPSPVVRYQQLALLDDWHPLFTCRCPKCEMPMCQAQPPRMQEVWVWVGEPAVIKARLEPSAMLKVSAEIALSLLRARSFDASETDIAFFTDLRNLY